MSYFNWTLTLCLALSLSACGDGPFTDGNEDPERATCDTVGVMSCTNSAGICHEFYSDIASDAILHACYNLGDDVYSGSCAADYTRCCIHMDGSNDYPEGICTNAYATYPIVQNECESSGHNYCGR